VIYGKGPELRSQRNARGNYPIYVAEQAGVGNKSIALRIVTTSCCAIFRF